MFDVTKIQDRLTGLVAVRQPLDPTYDRLDEDQYLCTSGQYLDDVQHFRLEYWIDAQNFATAADEDLQSAWSNMEKSAISNVVSQVFNKPSYIDRNLIYSNTFDRSKVRTLSNDTSTFYGYELKLSKRKNVAFLISTVRIEAFTDSNGGELAVQLFHSSQATPIKTKTIEVVNDGTLQIEQLDWYIDNSDQYYQGTFFLGYGLPDFVFKPYERDFNDANRMNNISELSIRPIINVGTFADLETIDTDDTHNGLNFDITIYEDYTDLVSQNKFMFAKAIQLQWATSVLLQVVSSSRSNKNQRISAEFLQVMLLSINGQRGFGLPTIVGLREMINGEIGRLQEEIEKLQRGYFPGPLTTGTLC